MFVRTLGDALQVVNGVDYKSLLGKANLYKDSFPFDRAGLGQNQPATSAVPFVAIHGVNPAVSSQADLWAYNGIRTFPSAGFTIGVSSSSAADVLTSGTGAWKVEIDVLDTSYALKTITLNLNGQSKVTDTNFVGTAYRINDVRCVDWGTGLVNAGDIYVYDASDTVTAGVPQTATKVFHMMKAGENVARGAFYTVPLGCMIQTQQVRCGFNDVTNASRAAIVNVKTYRFVNGKRVVTIFPLSGQLAPDTGMVTVHPDHELIFDEKTDITLQSQASSASVVAGFMDAVLFYK